MIRVLISDNLSPEGVKILQDAGFDVVVKTGLKPEELMEEIKNYDGIVVRSATKLKADIINAGKNLKVIGRAGVGLDNVDLDAATKKGIIVMNTPLGNTVSTAEHTMALMLSLARNLAQADISMRENKWERKKFMGVEVYGKVLGIVGLGRIGREVARRALGFGMKVIAYDPYVSEDLAKKIGIELMEYEFLLKNSDYITFHIPMTDTTYHLLGEKELKIVKNSVRIINCSRGGVVDEDALSKALGENRIAGVALDVYENEPPKGSALIKFPNTCLTPHLGASTEEAQLNVAIEVAEQVRDVLLGKAIRNAVNLPSLEPEVIEKMRPYLGLAEKLGLLAGQLAKGNVKSIQITYSGDILNLNVSPVTAALLKGFLSPVLMESVNYVNASLIAKEREISVEEVKKSNVGNFTNLIEVSIATNKSKTKVSGTLFSRENPRLVNIDGFYVEAIPLGDMVIIYNEDKPGVIGHIGSVFGKNGINISGMTFGREAAGGKALTVLNIDSQLKDSVIKELQSFEHIKEIKSIKL